VKIVSNLVFISLHRFVIYSFCFICRVDDSDVVCMEKDIILGQPASVSLAKRQENLQRIPYLMPGIY